MIALPGPKRTQYRNETKVGALFFFTPQCEPESQVFHQASIKSDSILVKILLRSSHSSQKPSSVNSRSHVSQLQIPARALTHRGCEQGYGWSIKHPVRVFISLHRKLRKARNPRRGSGETLRAMVDRQGRISRPAHQGDGCRWPARSSRRQRTRELYPTARVPAMDRFVPRPA